MQTAIQTSVSPTLNVAIIELGGKYFVALSDVKNLVQEYEDKLIDYGAPPKTWRRIS